MRGGGGVVIECLLLECSELWRQKAPIKSPRGYFCFEAPHKTRHSIMIENLGVQV